ncbi:MAG: 50S ribosomal protein L24 [Chloroflexi bacterium]|nr:50S ribosomal protein L24 [Chloroflexota bacterium]
MNKIRKGDTVQVIAGNDKGKRGEVHAVMPKKNQLIIAGIKMVKKHQKRTGDVRTQTGIIEREAPVNVSNVLPVCKHCGKAARMAVKTFEDGTKSRMCTKCGEVN